MSDYRRSKLDKLAKFDKISANEMARKIIDKYLSNELVENKGNKEEKLLELRIKKLEAEIKYMEIKNNYFENFGTPLSRKATVMIKPEIIVENSHNESLQSPYDAINKRIQCVECGVLFDWRIGGTDAMKFAMGEFKKHMIIKHSRELNPLENNVISNLEFEGNST
mgnify:CR=1 FL=1